MLIQISCKAIGWPARNGNRIKRSALKQRDKQHKSTQRRGVKAAYATGADSLTFRLDTISAKRPSKQSARAQ